MSMCESSRECASWRQRAKAAEAAASEAREVAQAIVTRLAALAARQGAAVCVDAGTGQMGKFPGRFIPAEAIREILRDAVDIGAPTPAAAVSVEEGILMEREACARLVLTPGVSRTLGEIADAIRNRRTS